MLLPAIYKIDLLNVSTKALFYLKPLKKKLLIY